MIVIYLQVTIFSKLAVLKKKLMVITNQLVMITTFAINVCFSEKMLVGSKRCSHENFH